MYIHHTLAGVRLDRPTALTIGVFDGVHRGHQHLIGEVVRRAAVLGGPSVVLTFEPHPDVVLWPDREHQALSAMTERIALITALGVEHLVIQPFDLDFSRLTAAEFMRQLSDHMLLRELWVGHDFRLGYGGAGSIDVLTVLGEQLGYSVHPVQPTLLDELPISSTRIRQELAAGEVAAAGRCLGRWFTVAGPVVKGDQRGRTIGFPTANIQTRPNQLLPADGVYACRVRLAADEPWLPAVTNIGVRPTFGVLNRTVEAHLLDWEGDLYDQTITLAFMERLRGEQKFSGIDALVAQIRQDAAQAATLLERVESGE